MNKLTGAEFTDLLKSCKGNQEMVDTFRYVADVMKETIARAKKAEATITALEAENKNLRKYVGHLDGCHITVVEGSPKMCSCKLNEILSKQESEQ